MLTAQKSAWFERIFAVYNRNLIKRNFNAFYVENLLELQKKNSQIPLVIFANHSCWWDGLAIFEISRRARLDLFVMMEEKQLERFFLFRRLGAFSVDRENARKAIKSLDYAVRILREDSRRTLWIFPQGKILPNGLRPFFFYQGLSRIVGKFKRIQVVSLALKYEFLNDFKPEIFAKIGKIELMEVSNKFDSKIANDNFAGQLSQSLDCLTADINAANFGKFDRII